MVLVSFYNVSIICIQGPGYITILFFLALGYITIQNIILPPTLNIIGNTHHTEWVKVDKKCRMDKTNGDIWFKPDMIFLKYKNPKNPYLV